MRTINISSQTIIRAIVIPAIIAFVWFNRDIIFSLFIAFILMAALRPIVDFLHKRKHLTRPLAAFIVYAAFIVVFIVLLSVITPPILAETIQFIERLPQLFAQIDPDLAQILGLNDLTSVVPGISNQLLSLVGNIFTNTLFVVTTFVFGFYFLANENILHDLFGKFVSHEQLDEVQKTLRQAENRMASWFWGELILMITVGVLSYIGFSIIGIKYALPLAVLAGLLEAVPNIGPIVAAIPAVLIGSTQAGVVGFAVLAWTIIVQQLENNVLVPYIMRKAVGINPITTMLCIIVGVRLGGAIGVLLAVPFYLILETVITRYKERKAAA
jgi:predicted PurR-regulated permease PerM